LIEPDHAAAMSDFQVATVLIALGDKEGALDHLEAAASRREGWIVWVNVDCMLQPLRDEPRFQRLVRDVMGTATAVTSPAVP
jgi:hypothetical protein